MWKEKTGFRLVKKCISGAFQKAICCLILDDNEVAVIYEDLMSKTGVGFEIRYPKGAPDSLIEEADRSGRYLTMMEKDGNYSRIYYYRDNLSSGDSLAVHKLKVLIQCRTSGWNVPDSLILEISECDL